MILLILIIDKLSPDGDDANLIKWYYNLTINFINNIDMIFIGNYYLFCYFPYYCFHQQSSSLAKSITTTIGIDILIVFVVVVIVN